MHFFRPNRLVLKHTEEYVAAWPLGLFGKWSPIVKRRKALVKWTAKLNVVFLIPGEWIEEDVPHFLRADQDVGQRVVVVVADYDQSFFWGVRHFSVLRKAAYCIRCICCAALRLGKIDAKSVGTEYDVLRARKCRKGEGLLDQKAARASRCWPSRRLLNEQQYETAYTSVPYVG